MSEKTSADLAVPTNEEILRLAAKEEKYRTLNFKEWDDITERVKGAVASLECGRIIHVDHFNLHSAMSALELMDPKMDPGIGSDKALTVDEYIARNPVPAMPTIRQMLATIDYLRVLEATFINGSDMGHTMFTCALLQRPSLVEGSPLHAYIVVLLKLIECMYTTVMEADIFEEEDFVAKRFNFDLCEDITSKKAAYDLSKAEQTILESGSGAADDNEEEGQRKALAARFRLLRHTYLAAVACRKPARSGFVAGKKSAKNALIELKAVEDSLVGVGDPTEAKDGEEVKDTLTEDHADVVACSSAIVHNLVPNAPPRKPRFVSVKKSVEVYRDMLENMIRLHHLCEVDSLMAIYDVVSALSAFEPNVFVRSLLWCQMSKPDDFLGLGSLSALVRTEVLQFARTSSVCIASDHATYWLTRVVQPVHDLFKHYCANRSRQQTYTSSLLGDWNTIEMEASYIDRLAEAALKEQGVQTEGPTAVCRHPYFSFVFELSTRLLALHLKLNVELDLLDTRELPVTFWYLSFLQEIRHQNHSICWKGLTSSGSGGASKKVKKKKGKKAVAPSGPSLPPRDATAKEMLVEAEHLLSQATLMVFHLFKKRGLYTPAPFTIGSEEVLFQNRFSIFSSIPQPAPLTFDQFKAHINYDTVDEEALLAVINRDFRSAKALVDLVLKHPAPLPSFVEPRLKAIARVIVTNQVTVATIDSTLAKAKEKDTTTEFNVSFDLHPHFPVLKLALKPKSK